MPLNSTHPMTLEDHSVNGQPIPEGWRAQDELAEKIAALDASPLPASTWRTLLSAIRSGLPVVITQKDQAMTSIKGTEVHQTGTLVVDYALVGDSHPYGSTASYLRVRSWGFGYNLYLADIVAVSTPAVTYSDV